MDILRVAGVTINQTPLDWRGNIERIIDALHDLRKNHVQFACFPELCLSGYGCEDQFFSPSISKQAEKSLAKIIPHTKELSVVIGLPHYFQGAMYNCAVLIQDCQILGINAKRTLAREGIHYEPRWFRSWPFSEVNQTFLCGQKVPIGDFSYKLGTLGVAVEICEEAWSESPASASHAPLVELIVNPSASHFSLGKDKIRRQLVANSSRSLKVHYLYTNLLGLEAGKIIYDGGILLASKGEIIGCSQRFGFKDHYIYFHDIDLDLTRTEKLKSQQYFDSKKSQMAKQISTGVHPHHFHRQTINYSLPQKVVSKNWHANEEFLEAEMLGLFDYLRKTKSKCYVLSLSGGCDSATIAVLIAHMIHAVFAELGSEMFAKKLQFESQEVNIKKCVNRLLKCIYQSTENSGSVTLNAAKSVAESIGADFFHVDVQSMIDGYLQQMSQILGRSLNWQNDDIALQNIQARARSPMIWLATNVFSGLLLATSNRSEATVGYATMDGDTSGGISPLAGIDKHFIRQWLRWAQNDNTRGLGAIGALKFVNEQEPTAELRPQGSDQKDEVDLMPYDILVLLEKCFIRDKMTAKEMQQILKLNFPHLNEELLAQYIEKFLYKWRINQWKRERYAPGFHIDDMSVDPKTWCRFPIISGDMKDD